MNYEKVLELLKSGSLNYENLLDPYFLLSVLDASEDGLLLSDEMANILYVNPAYLNTTSFTLSELIGRNLQEMIDNKLINESVSILVIDSKEPVSLTHRYITGKYAFSTGNPIFDKEGKLCSVLSNTRNIDELVTLRAQIQESKHLENKFAKELALLRESQLKIEGIIAESEEMQNVLTEAKNVAKYDSSVLIYGETGTGKEVLSKFIHNQSNRSNGPFIQFNCAAIPSELFESEFFGYEAGSFTGAKEQGKAGIIELANDGTLMLDEIGELPLSMQPKLLRVLQEKEFFRVGGTKPVQINIRIISATNKDLLEEAKKGLFRSDLYFRLNVMPLTIPPLRKRGKDINAFIDFFLKKLNDRYKKLVTMQSSARSALFSYDYPGNVRELQNLIEYLFITSKSDEISFEDLPPRVVTEHIKKTAKNVTGGSDLESMVNTYEKQIILNIMEKGTTLRSAAKVLGIHPSTLCRKLQKYQIKEIPSET